MDSVRRPHAVSVPVRAKSSGSSGKAAFKMLMTILCAFMVAGILFTIFAAPTSQEHSTHTYKYLTESRNAIMGGGAGGGMSLMEKVEQWLGAGITPVSPVMSSADPQTQQHQQQQDGTQLQQQDGAQQQRELSKSDEPDWSQEFWSPTSISINGNGDDATVYLCKLNFRKYVQNPHMYPMNKDLISMSGCSGRL
jgi:hypothetical protein